MTLLACVDLLVPMAAGGHKHRRERHRAHQALKLHRDLAAGPGSGVLLGHAHALRPRGSWGTELAGGGGPVACASWLSWARTGLCCTRCVVCCSHMGGQGAHTLQAGRFSTFRKPSPVPTVLMCHRSTLTCLRSALRSLCWRIGCCGPEASWLASGVAGLASWCTSPPGTQCRSPAVALPPLNVPIPSSTCACASDQCWAPRITCGSFGRWRCIRSCVQAALAPRAVLQASLGWLCACVYPVAYPLCGPRLMCANQGLHSMVMKIIIAGVSVIFYKATQAIAFVTGVAGIMVIIMSHRWVLCPLSSCETVCTPPLPSPCCVLSWNAFPVAHPSTLPLPPSSVVWPWPSLA